MQCRLSSKKNKYYFGLALVFSLFLFFTFIQGVSAATYYWVGANGADVNVSSNWTATNPTSCTGTAASVPGPSDTAIFDADCDNNANIPSDWTVNTLTMSSDYTGTVAGNAGVKLVATNLTQTSGTLNLSTIQQNRTTGTSFNFNGGTRSITTYLVSGYGSNCSVNVPNGQLLSVTDFTMMSGATGSISPMTTGNGEIRTVNLTHLDGSAVNLFSGTVNVTGNVYVASTSVNDVGSIKLNMIGTGDQTITNNSSALFATTLEINNSLGTTTVIGSEIKTGTFILTQGGFVATKLSTGTLTQTSGNLVLQALDHKRSGSTVTINGGTRSIDTINSVNGLSVSGAYSIIAGQTLSVNNYNISGTGLNARIDLPNSSGGRLIVGDVNFQSGTNVYFYGGVIYVNGNITTVSTVLANSASATIRLTGTGSQTITSASSATLAATFVVDKSSGTTTVNGTTFQVGAFTNTQGTFTNNTTTMILTGAYAQTGGTFNGGSGSISIGSNFDLSSTGVYNASTGTTTIAGSFTNASGGTFNHNNGSIVATGGATTWNVNSTINFYNFEVVTPNVANAFTIALGDTIVVNGNYVQTRGKVNTGTISVKGNATFVASAANGTGTGTILINGTTAQVITFNGGFLSSITINNSLASVSYNAFSTLVNLTINATSTSFDVGSYGITMSAYAQTGGTFNGGSGSISIGSNFDLSSTGVYNASTGTTTIAGSFTNASGGTFNHNNGSIVATGGATTWNVNSTINFYNFEVVTPNVANAFTIALGDTIVVNGNYVQTRGKVNTGTISVKGNATFVASAANGVGTGTILINGDTIQSVIFNGTYVSLITVTNSLADISFVGSNTLSALSITATTSPMTVTFASGVTQIITGAWTMAGSASNKIKLRSSTPTVQWQINPQGTRTLSYIDVKDSNNIGTTINAGSISGYVNSGNNTGWGDSGITTTPDPNRNWKGQTSNLWSVASNWWEGSVPGATENAIFNSAGGSNPALYDSSVSAGPLSIQISSGYNSTVTLGKAVSVSSTFTQTGATFTGAGYGLTTGGAAAISGGTFNAGSGEHNFDSGLTVSGGTYNTDSSISNVTGNFSQTSGTFNGNTGTITVTGNFSRTGGTFNGNTGLVSLTGGNQTISGTTTFANLSKIVSSAYTLTFPADKNTTIIGTTTLKGTSGHLLSLRSSSGGTQWGFDPQGGRVFEYLDVKDSNNIADEINAADHIGLTDANGVGSNTNWVFTIPVLNISATSTQIASTSLPVSNKYIGGAFVASSTVPGNITSITLSQVGSLLTSYISSVRLYYTPAVSGVCTETISGSSLFGSSSSWSGSDITITGTMSVGTDPVCIYPVFTLTGSFSLSTLYRTVDFEITNPSEDVVISNSEVEPITSVNIPGTTLVDGSSVTLPIISMSRGNSSIGTGASTTITWSVTNYADGCIASNDWSGSKSVSGGTERTDVLNEHRIYTFSLACHNANGTSTSAVYVNVINPNAPVVTFTASPTQVTSGQSAGLEWSNLGGINTPTSCIASGNWSGSQTPSGVYYTDAITSYRSYTLACGNSYGTTTKSVGVSLTGAIPNPHCANGDFDGDLGETAVDYGGPCGEGVAFGGGDIGSGDRVVLDIPGNDDIMFFFYNDGRHNALWMRTGAAGFEVYRKLTAENLNVVTGSFDEIGCGTTNECRGLRVNIVLEKISAPGNFQNYSIEKSFKTTVHSKLNEEQD
jgi:hypothetical protein